MQTEIFIPALGQQDKSFFKKGFSVNVTDGVADINCLGIAKFDLLNDNYQECLKLSKFILSHYHHDASHNNATVEAFYVDCLAELINYGGTLPHESVQDWLFFRGFQRGLNACQ